MQLSCPQSKSQEMSRGSILRSLEDLSIPPNQTYSANHPDPPFFSRQLVRPVFPPDSPLTSHTTPCSYSWWWRGRKVDSQWDSRFRFWQPAKLSPSFSLFLFRAFFFFFYSIFFYFHSLVSFPSGIWPLSPVSRSADPHLPVLFSWWRVDKDLSLYDLFLPALPSLYPLGYELSMRGREGYSYVVWIYGVPVWDREDVSHLADLWWRTSREVQALLSWNLRKWLWWKWSWPPSYRCGHLKAWRFWVPQNESLSLFGFSPWQNHAHSRSIAYPPLIWYRYLDWTIATILSFGQGHYGSTSKRGYFPIAWLVLFYSISLYPLLLYARTSVVLSCGP